MATGWRNDAAFILWFPGPLLSLLPSFQAIPDFGSSHSSAATWRGIFVGVIIIVLSIGPLIGLVSLVHGPEEFGIIGFDYQDYSYLLLNRRLRQNALSVGLDTTGRLFVS